MQPLRELPAPELGAGGRGGRGGAPKPREKSVCGGSMLPESDPCKRAAWGTLEGAFSGGDRGSPAASAGEGGGSRLLLRPARRSPPRSHK